MTIDALLDLLTLLVFACVLCAFYGLLGLSKRRQRAALCAERLARLLPATGVSDDGDIGSIIREMQAVPFAGVPILGERIERLWLAVNLLGWRRNLGVRLGLLGLGGTLIGVLLGLKTPFPLLCCPVFALAISVSLFLLLLHGTLTRQHKALRKNLPEAIDALTRACRAGVPVSNAFILVAENLAGPVATEFRIIDHWLRLGVPLRRVLQNSARRVQLPEYRFFAVILIINQESGGRLGETLERLSRTLREREELKMKVLAKTSEARASAKIVAALVPGMMFYMYFNAPADFLFLFNDPTGNKVLVYIVASVLVGLSVIQVMVRRIR